jgi:2,3-bisphosphoglycerate-independent phosphoglycerate mutase
MESMLDYQMDQMGNSEVGHMTIGSGRVLYQDLVKIHLAIKNDTLKR